MAESSSEKAVFVRVKRKHDQSPLHAFWLEINERPHKRHFLDDFQRLSLSYDQSSPMPASVPEELKTRRVLVQHVETVSTSESALDLLHSFVQCTSDGESKFKASAKERRRTLLKDKKHEQLLSKTKQDQKELAENARFRQIWNRRKGNKDGFHDEALDEVCRVYDVERVDEESTSGKPQVEISAEDQEILSKFLPLLRECIPSAAEDIESDICSRSLGQGSTDEYVYDVYAVKENTDEKESPYPFPLVQVDDDDGFYDGPEDSEYETDDSNAEDNPRNDYPEEESSEEEEEEEEESEKSGSESDREKSEAESEALSESNELDYLDRSEDPLDEFEMDDYRDGDDDEGWRWAYR